MAKQLGCAIEGAARPALPVTEDWLPSSPRSANGPLAGPFVRDVTSAMGKQLGCVIEGAALPSATGTPPGSMYAPQRRRRARGGLDFWLLVGWPQWPHAHSLPTLSSLFINQLQSGDQMRQRIDSGSMHAGASRKTRPQPQSNT